MIKEALQYLVSLKDNKTYEFYGDVYSDRELVRVAPHIDRPRKIELNGLDSVVKMVKAELPVEKRKLFIKVCGPRSVEVFSILDDYMGRDYLYEAVCDAPDFHGGWREQDNAIIELRSAFVPNEGTEYLLDLLSRICKDDSVTSEDNGVSQTVSARSGIGLKRLENLKSRIKLVPYRTFTEVEQPESEFILRLDAQGRVGLIEADGGKWKLDAKGKIKEYLESNLSEEVERGDVIVMM